MKSDRLAQAIYNLSIKKALLAYDQKRVHQAVDKELRNLYVDHDTWDWQTPEQVATAWSMGEIKNIISCSLFLKLKDALDTLKARLIIHGNKQILDLFGSTSSPTININILLLIISICAKKEHDFECIDIAGAYLNVDLPTPEYMRIPRDLSDILVANDPKLSQYVNNEGCIIVKIKKALYGLKTSGLLWYLELHSTLIDLGFQRSTIDKCLYSRTVDGKVTLACIYVDDIFLAGNDDGFRSHAIRTIEARFKKISRQSLNNVLFVGMQITKDLDGDISVSQKTLIDNILADMNINQSSKEPCSSDAFNLR